jgi:hypothetical protein
MPKFSSICASLFVTLATTALASAPASKLDSFDYLRLGMPYQELVTLKALCDSPKESPNFRDGLAQGVSSTVCPTSETFAMATLLHDTVASVAVNWVSWDIAKVKAISPTLSPIPGRLRAQYGIPSATLPYESEFGNRQADELCSSPGFSCHMHIWKAKSPDRVASLVFAKNIQGEVPLLFHLTDLALESRIDEVKNRSLQAAINKVKNEIENSH